MSSYPDPGLLPWSSHCWVQYMDAWTSKTSVNKELLSATPIEIRPLLFNSEGYIQRKRMFPHLVANYTTSLMMKYSVIQILDKLNIDVVDMACTPNPLESSVRPPYVGSEENPLKLHLSIDTFSYDRTVLDRLDSALEKCAKNLLSRRFSSNSYTNLYAQIFIVDVRETSVFPSDWFRFSNISPGSATPTLFGLSHKEIQNPEQKPTLVHGWRSRTPSSALLAISASGSLTHRSELYLRWLQAKKDPLHVRPLDEDVIEKHWPGAVKTFQAWSALGLEERTTLHAVLTSANQIKENSEPGWSSLDDTLFEPP